MPLLCERLRRLVDDVDCDEVDCDVRALVADIIAIEALARLQLTARRLGCPIRLRRHSRELQALLDFCGLAEVVPCDRLRDRVKQEDRLRGR